ncbi:transcriptional regulator [Candidatus Epulonipiscium fishelsonii]|uniref:Transcriptional regulator n=1 Tax=Candidatus Epulonipiscium fishelsonii TaxID=77094 RepID=A0ACC8X8W7_9FIRM|nr:transcriptional regulator [Epulopiscium sp. SCG-B11WGA-EpuloA1]ONI38420.1 transcriptional regulator [Epulopiscium sp. SCG-B05WGA-EpuloA1]ONI47920.1 transcriptional regulator [Epulopiscium sp. SCG-C06WGA-EpuloA1]
MSGHSKFANIKHKKARNDAQKGKIFTKMGREIAVAVKEGGPDPLLNNKLADIIRKAKSNNMPNDTIQRSIKKASGDANSVNYEYITYEGYGPNGIAVIVETLTDNKNRTAANVRAAFAKGNGNMGTTGCVSFMFDKKGQIFIDQDATDMDEDEFMMFVIDAGADDFEAEDEMYIITTSPETFSEVCSKIETKGIEMVDAKITMIPQTVATLEEVNFKAWDKMMALLEEDDDVQEVYHNCENATI